MILFFHICGALFRISRWLRSTLHGVERPDSQAHILRPSPAPPPPKHTGQGADHAAGPQGLCAGGCGGGCGWPGAHLPLWSQPAAQLVPAGMEQAGAQVACGARLPLRHPRPASATQVRWGVVTALCGGVTGWILPLKPYTLNLCGGVDPFPKTLNPMWRGGSCPKPCPCPYSCCPCHCLFPSPLPPACPCLGT